MIDVLVPVLDRPDNAQRLADSLAAHTTIPYQLVFLTTPGDTAEYEACCATGANVLIVENPRPGGDYALKINQGFAVTSSPYILCAADDVEFTPDWDTTLLAVARMSGAGVIGTNDMANPDVKRGLFSTHPLVTRDYINEIGGSLEGPGFVYSLAYDHNYVDRELAGLARFRGEWAFAIESCVIHRRPPADATYKKGAKNFHRDHVVFMKRAENWEFTGVARSEQAWLDRRAKRQQPRRRHP